MATRSAAARLNPPAMGGLPGDVRLMNVVSGAVFVGVAFVLLAAGTGWLARAPMFEIAVIRVQGDLTRNSAPTIRANALPALAGSFFSVDLAQARRAFEQVPWVRRAVVRRVWPNELVVQIEEHRAAALWEGRPGAGGDGAERLVNTHGEVFEANLGDVEDEDLPLFVGPDGQSAPMLALWRRLQPAFAERGLAIEKLRLSGRGSWRVELDNGASVVLGRGGEDELMARAGRFLRTLAQVRGRWNAPLEYADLRHADGYALRLRGVSTLPGRGALPGVVGTPGPAANAANGAN
jgi:cell division protein FtsQ